MYSILDLLLLLIPEQVLSNNRGNFIHHPNKDKGRDRGDHKTQDQYQRIWSLPLPPAWMGIRHGDHQREEVGIHYHQEEGGGLLV
jgi:hypothetical protein